MFIHSYRLLPGVSYIVMFLIRKRVLIYNFEYFFFIVITAMASFFILASHFDVELLYMELFISIITV